ncbi:MAG TPA: nucleotide sugar dehydrogenase, partial [Candidatus Methanomethylophilaceae archaeon]|nr:nucleotide sugar dehydrogenase [Candidatus Methanomethylophilaceae archaeon]
EAVNRGDCPIGGKEPGLAELLRELVKKRMLIASTDFSSLADADLIVVCVDTPVDEEKRPVLHSLRSAVSSIASNMKEGVLVSIESTIPPGTMQELVIPLLEEGSGMKAGKDFSVVHCPERVMPGRLLANLKEYKRVLGGLDERSVETALKYYSTFIENEILITSLINAEICKTGENAYRDVQIAFANEMALICEELGADVFEVRRLINSCPFRDMHIPGSGVGGYCLPKDSWLLLANVKKEGLKVISGARSVNEMMPHHLVEMTVGALEARGEGKAKVAVMGVAFIADSDDTRNSPALKVIDELAPKYDVVAHDPYVKIELGVPLYREADDALKDADCAVFVTDHSCYSELDPERLKELSNGMIIVDGRNIFNREEMERAGLEYYGIGKGRV